MPAKRGEAPDGGDSQMPVSRRLLEETTAGADGDWHAVVRCMLSRARALDAEARVTADLIEAAFLRGQAHRCFWDAYEVAAEASLMFPWSSYDQFQREPDRE